MYLISNGGISCNLPDTMEAIMLTKYLNYINGIKLDVRESLDHVFLLSKYDELDKFTLSKGKISKCNYDYLKKVRFNSHIFKYYLPTLEEVLKKYYLNKIIFLMLYNIESLDKLKKIIIKYPYKYYFASNSKETINDLKKNNFDLLGIIIDQEINDDSDEYFINIENTVLLISKYPEKIKKALFDKK